MDFDNKEYQPQENERMSGRTKHTLICKQKGIDEDICDVVNRWMDEPSHQYPGCSHRQFRHSEEDCREVAKQVFTHLYLYEEYGLDAALEATVQVYAACQIHREVDRENESCGCKALYEQ